MIPQQDLRQVESDERVLHHPDELRKKAARALRDAPAAREAARRARRDRAARWAGRRLALGPRQRPLRAQEAQGRRRRAPVRDLDRADHARGRARAEAGRRRPASCFKPLSAGEFVRAENELQELLDVGGAESGSKVERKIGRVRLRVARRPRPRLRGSRRDGAPGRARSWRRAASAPQLLAAVFPFEAARASPSTGSTASSGARSGRSCPRARARSATTRRSSS